MVASYSGKNIGMQDDIGGLAIPENVGIYKNKTGNIGDGVKIEGQSQKDEGGSRDLNDYFMFLD